MRADSQGMLWIPSYNSGSFYRYNPADNSFFKEFNVPTGPGDMVYALAIDPGDDSVWLCGTNSDSIIHFHPNTESFDVFQLLTRVSFTANWKSTSTAMSGPAHRICPSTSGGHARQDRPFVFPDAAFTHCQRSSNMTNPASTEKQSMLAGAYLGVGKIEAVERDIPTANAGEVIIKVARAGICGTDMHTYLHGGFMPEGMTIGHEFSGIDLRRRRWC